MYYKAVTATALLHLCIHSECVQDDSSFSLFLFNMEVLIVTVVKCPNIFNTDKLELFTAKLVSSKFSLDLAFVEIVCCWIIGGIVEMCKMYSKLRSSRQLELG